MSLTDYLKCPGLEHTLSVIPEEYPCPGCGSTVEIWSDEKQGRCRNCGELIKKSASEPGRGKEQKTDMISQQQLRLLMDKAIRLGASEAACLPSTRIVVEEALASLCNGSPKCEHYGLSLSCPPHVSGPSEFRTWQGGSEMSIVVRIDVPSQIMHSHQGREIMRLLHEIVASVEKGAADMGYKGSKAFAGGSCKNLFCRDEVGCRALSEKGSCRNPESARPSMSGFGICVEKLMASLGWTVPMPGASKAVDAPMAWVAGLVLIAKAE